MIPRIAIIAALDREVRPLVKRWRLESTLNGVRSYSKGEVITVCAGMGRERARLAAETALGSGPIRQFLSVGWAGALHREMRVGMAQIVNSVIDARTGERFESNLQVPGWKSDAPVSLLSTDRIVSASEKFDLRKLYSADLVDMEAATIGRVAKENGIPFAAIKAVSDDHDFDLPAMGSFITREGRVEEARFVRHIATRPGLWKSVVAVARNSRTASAQLALEVKRHVAQLGVQV